MISLEGNFLLFSEAIDNVIGEGSAFTKSFDELRSYMNKGFTFLEVKDEVKMIEGD